MPECPSAATAAVATAHTPPHPVPTYPAPRCPSPGPSPESHGTANPQTHKPTNPQTHMRQKLPYQLFALLPPAGHGTPPPFHTPTCTSSFSISSLYCGGDLLTPLRRSTASARMSCIAASLAVSTLSRISFSCLEYSLQQAGRPGGKSS
eukprot:360821-Chlamydomonas_euryale.AAC.3